MYAAEYSILLRVASGDQKAFRMLFDQYWDGMYANALHFTKSPELAQDLAQEIFTKVWLMRDKLPEIERFDAWLYRVAKNMILDEMRRLQQSPDYAEFMDAYFLAGDQDAHQPTTTKDIEKQLHAAIAQLPAQMQTAFRLSRFEGLTHEQIAQKMNISKVTSQNYIARSLVAIKKYMAELGIFLLMMLKH
ncbi:sigma-70 family RNA polymerase sigma factor [Chitinophaga sp.]|uniref:RNA polymerase sigma factor n=1 Tax=Chitinophaga sp. TaxID=1869181 RepID=UPI0031D9FD5A